MRDRPFQVGPPCGVRHDKPDSVAGDTHHSVRIHFSGFSALPCGSATTRDLGGRPQMVPVRLAPDWVCRASLVTLGAVSSYLTVSPLPFLLRDPAVCFLWHFPSRLSSRPALRRESCPMVSGLSSWLAPCGCVCSDCTIPYGIRSVMESL